MGKMSLLLVKRDGTVKAKCRECGQLCVVPGSSNGEAVCGKCVGERKRDRRREYIPGGVISLWNRESYEEYENSAAGIEERKAWEREMLSQVDEA